MSPDGYSAVRILFFAHSLDYVRIAFCTLVAACVKWFLHTSCGMCEITLFL